MSWTKIETSTTVAPRELERPNPEYDSLGYPKASPSVGGTATVKHEIWKCGYGCGAMAVTGHGYQPTGECGVCHGTGRRKR